MTGGAEGAPSTQDVADAIGAEADLLRNFVDHHPEPTAAVVLGAFGGDPEHTQLIEEWLEFLEDYEPDRPKAWYERGETR